MDDEDLILYIEEMSTPVIREGENIVTFSPGGDKFNAHQVPEWAYQRLLSDSPKVHRANQSSDALRIRVGYKNSQAAGTLISRVCELEKRIEIEHITITPHSQIAKNQFTVIADICYAKDNLDSLLYVLQDIEVGFLDTTNTEYISIIK